MSKPKCAVAWGFAAAWFGGFVTASSLTDFSMTIWNVGLIGQVGLVAMAILVGVFEKPILKTRLVENPDRKPQALY